MSGDITMEEKTTCTWCESEIIWDPEIGPEKYCPHCDNELSGYRTIEVDADDVAENEEEEYNWDEDEEGRGILRSARELATHSVISQILNEQFEVPECPNCREFMLETGTQTVGAQGDFEAKLSPNQTPLLKTPFKVIHYVCPSCYRTENYLNYEDRKHLLDELTPKDEI